MEGMTLLGEDNGELWYQYCNLKTMALMTSLRTQMTALRLRHLSCLRPSTAIHGNGI